MRNYELVFVIQPDLDETAVSELIEKVKGWITESGGAIEKIEMMGKRKLAYQIRKQREGQYVLVKASMAPSFGVTLERNLRFTEPILRFLLAVVE